MLAAAGESVGLHCAAGTPMPFLVPPLAQRSFSLGRFCWHVPLFLVDPRCFSSPLAIFVSLPWVLCPTPCAPCSLVGPFPGGRFGCVGHGPVERRQHPHPSEASLRQRVPVLVEAQPGARPVVGRELSACMGQVWSVGPPRGSWCCALAAGALGSVLPAALALHHQGGSTAAPPFLWLVGGLDLWRERKVCHKHKMLSGEAGTERRLELLNASPQRPKHPLFVPAGFWVPGSDRISEDGSLATRVLIMCSQPVFSSAFRGLVLFWGFHWDQAHPAHPPAVLSTPCASPAPHAALAQHPNVIYRH